MGVNENDMGTDSRCKGEGKIYALDSPRILWLKNIKYWSECLEGCTSHPSPGFDPGVIVDSSVTRDYICEEVSSTCGDDANYSYRDDHGILQVCTKAIVCSQDIYYNITDADSRAGCEPADDGLSAGAIAGIVTAGIFVAAGLAGAAVGLCICRWRSRNRGNDNQQPEEVAMRDIEAKSQREVDGSGDVTTPLSGDHPAAISRVGSWVLDDEGLGSVLG